MIVRNLNSLTAMGVLEQQNWSNCRWAHRNNNDQTNRNNDGFLGSAAPLLARVRWNTTVIVIPLFETGDEFLIGTALLEDLRIMVTFRFGERLTISPA